MKIVEINVVANGSTGNIMLNLAKTANKDGHRVKTFSTYIYNTNHKTLPPAPDGHKYFGSHFGNCTHAFLGQFTGLNGCFSRHGTRRLIKEIKKINPDVVHLHNLHTFCINLPMLFKYIKKNNIPVVWTLHDCWTFTGHCPHFVMAKCDKWKTECHNCPQLSIYPKSRVDNTKMAHRLKKKWFLGVENMTLVTPSEWLANLTRESFMGVYPVKVINNGIDLSVFKPTEGNFREKYNLTDKKVLLGVAAGFEKRKGTDVFIELASRLDDDYRIVLVGVGHTTRELPKNIITIPRTANQTELAEIYTAADLFVNPTREDTFPTVNMEALACGTPVLTFRTGGSPEILDEACGCVVDVDDVDAMEQEIVRICTENPYSAEDCLARAKNFDMYNRFDEYVKLYQEVIKQ